MAKNVLAICVLLWAPMALANQVTQVSAKDGNVRITADEPPNFTTFTIDYPPRLVVDLAGATLVDVPTNIPVGQNGVQGIQTLPYGSGTTAVARIIIMYEKPVQTEILTDGNSIVVRQAETPAPATAPAPVLAKAQAAPPPPSPTPAAPGPPPVEHAAAAPPSPTPPPEPAAPQLAAPLPPSPRPAASEPLVAAPPPAQPPRNPDNAVPEAPAKPAAVVVAENEPTAPATPAYPASPASPASEDQAAPPPAPAPSPAPPAAPAQAAAEAPPLKLNTQAQLASPPPPSPTEEPPHVSARRKTLSLVGLRFNNGATSVFVRTNEPVSYHVSARPNGLVVTIENTRIRRHNDARPLDAQFFDSPVAKVRASQNRGDVEVTIDLKTQAAYQATQTGREVELNFSQKG